MSLINTSIVVSPVTLLSMGKKKSNEILDSYEIIESEVCFDLLIVDDNNATVNTTLCDEGSLAPKYEAHLCCDGVGGTYFIKDEKGVTIGVFKPTDEEPGAVNDPKGLLKEPPMPPGGGSIREIAAYLLDHGRRAGVPETYFLSDVENEAFHYAEGVIKPKSGSVQKFVENIGDADCMGSSRYCVEDVHNIGILDIRLYNMDRNLENILVRKEIDEKGLEKFRLVPIDHAFTLPSTLGGAWFDWMYWKQAKAPFSNETLEYIRSLNIDEDTRILKSLRIGEEYIRTMRICTILLKKAVEVGKTLYDISSLICRRQSTEESVLERLVALAEDEIKTESTPGNFEEIYERLVNDFVVGKLNLR